MVVYEARLSILIPPSVSPTEHACKTSQLFLLLSMTVRIVTSHVSLAASSTYGPLASFFSLFTLIAYLLSCCSPISHSLRAADIIAAWLQYTAVIHSPLTVLRVTQLVFTIILPIGSHLCLQPA